MTDVRKWFRKLTTWDSEEIGKYYQTAYRETGSTLSVVRIMDSYPCPRCRDLGRN
jgi:hypothetical protein